MAKHCPNKNQNPFCAAAAQVTMQQNQNPNPNRTPTTKPNVYPNPFYDNGGNGGRVLGGQGQSANA